MDLAGKGKAGTYSKDARRKRSGHTDAPMSTDVADGVAEDAWEKSKENVMPLKRGRSVKGLKLGLGGSTKKGKSLIETQRQGFEAELQSNTSSDPLDIWIRYIKWMQAAFPKGSTELLPVLERCTRECRVHAWQYAQDKRFLKVWIIYADLCSDAEDIFAFMEDNNIGTNFSLFFQAKAVVHESSGNFAKADKTYEAGIMKGAAPVEQLRKAHREFEHRMIRRMQKAREAEQQEGPTKVTKERKSLQKLSRSSAKSSRRPMSRPSKSSSQRRTTSSSAQSAAPKGNFQIFEGDGSDSIRDAPAWNQLGTQKQRHKENVGVAVPWRGETLKQKKGQAASESTEFQVFTDESCGDEGGVAKPRAAGPGLRNYLDQSPSSSKHRLAARIKSQPLSSTTAQSVDTRVVCENQMAASCATPQDLADEDDGCNAPLQGSIDTLPATNDDKSEGGCGSPTMTFNSKAALADVHDMFSGPVA
eukprot:SAG11_NODE_5546_length_1530_cov_1.257862_1_plen_473_part_10